MYQIFVFDAFLEITIIKLIVLLEMGNNSTKELKTCPIKFSNLVFALEKQIEKSKKELLNIFTKMAFMIILSKLMLNRTRDKGHCYHCPANIQIQSGLLDIDASIMR